jgi:hypothetical protein
MAWDCGTGHYFDFFIHRRLALNTFLFPVTTAKLIGEFYNNRQSTAHRCLRFTYSLMSLTLHQYYWYCDSCPANRQNAANKQKSAKTPNWCCECTSLCLWTRRVQPASPKSAGYNAAPLILAVLSL